MFCGAIIVGDRGADVPMDFAVRDGLAVNTVSENEQPRCTIGRGVRFPPERKLTRRHPDAGKVQNERFPTPSY